MRPGDTLANFIWFPVPDVLGIVHWTWRRTHSAHSFRLCLDDGGPEVASRMASVFDDAAVVTCLWCISVRDTL